MSNNNKSISDLIGGRNNIVNNGLNRLDDSNKSIVSNNHLKLKPKYFEISWQTYRILGFVFFALSFGIMKYIVDYFSKTIEDKELISILKIISFFFILNFGTFLFITIYYKYRKSIKGAKGRKGPQGKRGPQGDSSYCNICKEKSGSYRREFKNKSLKEEIVPSVMLSFSSDVPPYWKILNRNLVINKKKFRIMTPSYLGPGFKSDVENSLLKPRIPSDKIVNEALKPRIPSDEIVNEALDSDSIRVKPIIGLSASYNKETGEIYSIMFLKDKNKIHNPRKYKYTPISKNVIGKTEKMGIGIEFKCPKNSAIYKVELYHNREIIKSIRFYCADIETGKPIDVLDPSTNKIRKYATIGLNVSNNNSNLVQEMVEAGHFLANGKYYQTFISQVGAYLNKDTKQIYSLGFLRSSLFIKDFKFEKQLNNISK